MRSIKIAAGVSLLLLLTAGFSSIDAGANLAPIYQLLFFKPEKAVELSDVQKQIVAAQGYPQQFVKTFGVENGQQRINEVWTYITNGAIDSFVNGQYTGEKALTVSDASFPPGDIHPEAYQAFDTPATILARHGTPLATKEAQIWNGSITMFVYSNILFHFNNGKLDTVFYSFQPVVGDGPSAEDG